MFRPQAGRVVQGTEADTRIARSFAWETIVARRATPAATTDEVTGVDWMAFNEIVVLILNIDFNGVGNVQIGDATDYTGNTESGGTSYTAGADAFTDVSWATENGASITAGSVFLAAVSGEVVYRRLSSQLASDLLGTTDAWHVQVTNSEDIAGSAGLHIGGGSIGTGKTIDRVRLESSGTMTAGGEWAVIGRR